MDPSTALLQKHVAELTTDICCEHDRPARRPDATWGKQGGRTAGFFTEQMDAVTLGNTAMVNAKQSPSTRLCHLSAHSSSPSGATTLSPPTLHKGPHCSRNRDSLQSIYRRCFFQNLQGYEAYASMCNRYTQQMKAGESKSTWLIAQADRRCACGLS